MHSSRYSSKRLSTSLAACCFAKVVRRTGLVIAAGGTLTASTPLLAQSEFTDSSVLTVPVGKAERAASIMDPRGSLTTAQIPQQLSHNLRRALTNICALHDALHDLRYSNVLQHPVPIDQCPPRVQQLLSDFRAVTAALQGEWRAQVGALAEEHRREHRVVIARIEDGIRALGRAAETKVVDYRSVQVATSSIGQLWRALVLHPQRRDFLSRE